jgi:arginase family enzyme
MDRPRSSIHARPVVPLPIARNMLVLTGLAALLAVQAFRPAELRAGPLPVAPASEGVPLPPIAFFSAAPVPGVQELVAQLPYTAQPLGLDPQFVIAALTGKRVPPDAAFFPMPSERARPLTLNGHGDFHHLTFYVLRDVVEPLGTDFTLVNFDAHDDARSAEADEDPAFSSGLDCGNWTRFALARFPHLKRVLQIGRTVQYDDLARWIAPDAISGGRLDLYPARPMRLFFHATPDLARFDGTARRDLLVTGAWQLEPRVSAWRESLSPRIPTRDVYITVDLDVVRAEDFDDLGWGNGLMSRAEIIAAIDSIAKDHRVIGADITGFPPDSQRKISYARCFETYRAIAGALSRALGAAP